MTSRRTRIKVVAKIPQRRKNDTDEDRKDLGKDNVDTGPKDLNEMRNVSPVSISETIDAKFGHQIDGSVEAPEHVKDRDSIICPSNIIRDKDTINSSDRSPDINDERHVKVEQSSILNNMVSYGTPDNENVNRSHFKTEHGLDKSISNPKEVANVIESINIAANDKSADFKSSEPKVRFMRRKVNHIPKVVNAIHRKTKEKPKQHCENVTYDYDKTTKDIFVEESSYNNENNENFLKNVPVKNSIVSENSDKTVSALLNNTCVPTLDGSIENDMTATIKIPANLSIKTAHSDTEYPPPPPSPNKINRTRIKAIPRLDYRKASFSASESEDESRKNNRIRNDSVCSTTSAVAESITECHSPQRPKEMPAVVPKKCVRSDQTRKLAEARREFQRKFGPSKPERSKLTMMDLLFYNPDSNPMVEETNKNEDEPNQEETLVDPKPTVINIPEDTFSQNEKEDIDESAMPVPQIKIGPSGEIVIDEQSLVIERKELKKQREEMAKTKIVNGDFDTGYGIYKKHKRSKQWRHHETVRFYKAINILGTDFTLMTELFPNRTRRELKMKFKKEENLNNVLINRAIMQPGNFDFDDLKNEVEMEEKEMEELEKQKEMEIKQREEDRKMNQDKRARRAEKRKIAEREKEANFKLNKPPKPKPQPRSPKKLKKQKRTNSSFMENSDADESDIATQSESDTATQSESDDEIVMPQGPTRSGRVPKVVRKYENDMPSVENVISNSKVPVNLKTHNVEPGSIMIITETGPNGDPVYKIFMVTPDQNAQPLQLPSDIIAKAIELKKGVTAKNIMTISASVTDDETDVPAEENNMTIPADENVTTLKSECSENGVGKYDSEVPEYNSEVEVNTNVTIPAEQEIV